MEDPTADTTEDEGEEQLSLKRLSYLLRIPEYLKENASYLLNWAQVCSNSCVLWPCILITIL